MNESVSPAKLGRRSAIAGTALAATTLSPGQGLAGDGGSGAESSAASVADAAKDPGRLKQSVCRWCFPKWSIEQLAAHAKSLGLVGIDLLDPDSFPIVKDHGLVCTMVNSHPLTDGLCDPRFHEASLATLRASIEATAAEGWRNVICFSGNARGIDPQAGMRNCVEALRKILPVAESNGVTLVMELLNSKVDHPDYLCDNTTWGVELVKQVGSDHFKLLYDIYHMQIMEGDLIRTIREQHPYIGHYHTAGNPGRNELNDQQELFYPAIARAIADTGFDGYFAHEFIPKGDPLAGLTDAVRQCTV